MTFFEPMNSVLIGLAEMTLAMLVFHRAIPAMMELSREALPFWESVSLYRKTMARVFGSVGNLRQLIRAIAISVDQFVHCFEPRILIFKYWALGFALGSFGIGRAFGKAYLQPDVWLFTIGHYGLISYVTLRLVHISHRSSARWWRYI